MPLDSPFFQILSREHRAGTPLEPLESLGAPPSHIDDQQLQRLLANAESRVSVAENQALALNARCICTNALQRATCDTLPLQLRSLQAHHHGISVPLSNVQPRFIQPQPVRCAIRLIALSLLTPKAEARRPSQAACQASMPSRSCSSWET